MSRSEEGAASRGPVWAVAVSSVLGLGFTPRMPGTVGALVGVFVYLPAFLMPAEWVFALPLAELAVILLLSAVAVPGVLRASGLHDPSWVVLDEVAGMLCALCMSPPNFVRILLAFLFFRALDIFKPWPVNRLERLPGAWGVMADDILAGLLAGVLSILAMRFS